MKREAAWLCLGAGMAVFSMAAHANGQDFAPPALARVPDSSVSGLFHLDPNYPRPDHLKVIAAFTVTETKAVRLVTAWSPGFLPVTLSFSDGRCFSLTADDTGGSLFNGRLVPTSCDRRKGMDWPAPPPGNPALTLAGAAWGYAAWVDDRTGLTIVTSPAGKTFEPLFTADMTTLAITAINAPDWPSGNVTLIGRIKGQLTVVILDVWF